jgi:hypothetical protein
MELHREMPLAPEHEARRGSSGFTRPQIPDCLCEACADARERNARRKFTQPINPNPITSVSGEIRSEIKAYQLALKDKQ